MQMATIFRHRKKLYPLALITLIGLFLVNLIGFVDTKTGSTFGCGEEWPLCNGEWIPSEWDKHVAIEYTHRVSVLVDMILLFVLTVLSWTRYRDQKEMRIIIGVCFSGFIGESVLGALTVLFDNPPWVLAFHMGMALTSVVGLYLWTGWLYRNEVDPLRHQQEADPAGMKKLGQWAWFAVIYFFFVVYFGAYVSFTGSGSFFQGWPVPTEPYDIARHALVIDWVHRLSGFVLLLLILRLSVLAYRMRHERKDLWSICRAMLILIVLQFLSGGLLIYTGLSLAAFLLHVTFPSLVICLLSWLAFKTVPQRRKGALKY
jgi:heme a synthase